MALPRDFRRRTRPCAPLPHPQRGSRSSANSQTSGPSSASPASSDVLWASVRLLEAARTLTRRPLHPRSAASGSPHPRSCLCFPVLSPPVPRPHRGPQGLPEGEKAGQPPAPTRVPRVPCSINAPGFRSPWRLGQGLLAGGSGGSWLGRGEPAWTSQPGTESRTRQSPRRPWAAADTHTALSQPSWPCLPVASLTATGESHAQVRQAPGIAGAAPEGLGGPRPADSLKPSTLPHPGRPTTGHCQSNQEVYVEAGTPVFPAALSPCPSVVGWVAQSGTPLLWNTTLQRTRKAISQACASTVLTRGRCPQSRAPRAPWLKPRAAHVMAAAQRSLGGAVARGDSRSGHLPSLSWELVTGCCCWWPGAAQGEDGFWATPHLRARPGLRICRLPCPGVLE